MSLDHYLRFSVIPGDWHLNLVEGCSAVPNRGVDKETEHQTSAGGQTDIQTVRNRGTIGKVWRHRTYEEDVTEEEGRRGIKILKGKRENFKGLREQMANCTRVSQPGSKSVLCIRAGVGEMGWGGGLGEGKRGHGGGCAV